MSIVRLDYFYEIAGIIANSFVHYLPGDMEIDDVIQELVIDLSTKLQVGKFSTDDEAWVICQHQLFRMFREWDTARRRDAKAQEELDRWSYMSGVDDVLDHLYEDSSVTVLISVSGSEIARAVRDYGGFIRGINTHGFSELTRVQKSDGFLFVDGVLSPKFLAGITKALVILGTTPTMAVKVVSTGLKSIRKGYEWTEEDSMLLRNYRRRISKSIRWYRLPGGSIILRRGRFRLRIERI